MSTCGEVIDLPFRQINSLKYLLIFYYMRPPFSYIRRRSDIDTTVLDLLIHLCFHTKSQIVW